MKKNIFYLLVVIGMAFHACVPNDDVLTDGDAMLSFSVDTLRFDTVFTDLGSATRYIRVYNNYDQPVEISEIKLGRGTQSKFRINVDGIPGDGTNVEVPANDSIYVFAEVTIDPNQDLSASPFVIEEDLEFITNGNRQRVVLEAWGQNANYIPNQFANGGIAALQCNGQDVVWDDPKPYVIFGILVIDQCNLVIPAGTNIYVHGGLESTYDSTEMVRQFYNDGRIITTGSGSIRIEGTVDNPVTIQGDRLESGFSEVSGQWFGMILGAGSKNNSFEHLILKNSSLGIAVDSAGMLDIKNSQIYNTASHGLFGINAEMNIDNCLLYNNGATAIRMTYGGDYSIRYTTVQSNGESAASAMSIANILCTDFPDCTNVLIAPIKAEVENCILVGSGRDEISLIEFDQEVFDYSFKNCIVKVDELLDDDQYPNFLADCENCIEYNRSDILFADDFEYDFHLDTLSIAEGKASVIADLQTDLDEVVRDPQNPDIGCYEYIYE